MRRRSPLALAVVLGLLVAASAGAYPETWVSYTRLLAQARSGPLIRAIINPQRKDVEIKFTNLDEWHAYYPPGAQARLQRLFDARHIRLLFVRAHETAARRPVVVHHHLRYIAGGVAAALIVCAGAFALWRRRRPAAQPAGPG